MATSGTATFDLNRNEIITEALELCGVIQATETPSADDVTSCARKLNMLIKSWVSLGYHIWAQSEATQTLVAGTYSYTLGSNGNRPWRINDMWLRDSDGLDRPIDLISREEYNALPDKTTQGKPVKAYYDRQKLTGTLKLWPAPDSATDTVYYVQQRVLQDFNASTDSPDLATEWGLAVCYNLAKLIAPVYSVPSDKLAYIVGMAESTLDDALAGDREDVSVQFTPDDY